MSTKVALVALNARIEQDATQQEIASSIQAAFHSVDYAPPQQPSLLAIKQRNSNQQTAKDPSSVAVQKLPVKAWGRSESPVAKTATSNHTSTPVRVLPSSQDRRSPSVSESSRKNSEKEALVIDDEEYSVPKRQVSPAVNLKRSSSLLNLTPKNAPAFRSRTSRQLQRSLSDLTADAKEEDDFVAEQERLQREYLKLQRQFLLWQQQLMNNHAMLREECIVPQYVQARTLRQSHSLPEGEDTFDTSPSSGVPPLVSRSLSYEPTKDRCSTLPRSAINITSLEFGSIPHLTNGTSTLRSSKTKSYFKPPQVRASTKSRQRLPPEIKREGDVDITDDAKMLTTILPSFETLKLITENHDEDSTNSSRLKADSPARINKNNNTEGSGTRKVPVVHLSSTFSKLSNGNNTNSKLSNGTADKSDAIRDLKYVNGDSGQSSSRRDCPVAKTTEQSAPPPPPMPTVVNGKNSIKSVGQRNGVASKRDFTPSVDPREKLMLEIRKFGGRTALRKVSNLFT